MFLHEMDHINGMTMTHWRLSEGNIDIIEGEKDNYKNLASVSNYKIHSCITLNVDHRFLQA